MYCVCTFLHIACQCIHMVSCPILMFMSVLPSITNARKNKNPIKMGAKLYFTLYVPTAKHVPPTKDTQPIKNGIDHKLIGTLD